MKIQKAVLCAALIFCLEVFAKGPPPLQNFAPIVLDNQSGVADSEVYFLAHGLDPCGLPCYLVPDGMGVCDYVYPNASGLPSSASSMVSKKLTNLPAADGYPNGRVVYLPINSSSRAYLSVYNPMYLPTAYNPAPTRKVLDILDASVTTLRDANYYTLYQDFEFGLVSLITDYNIIPYRRTYGTQLYLNLSWVDFFALPMQLDVCTYPSGTVLNGQYTPSSGFDPSTSRETIIANMIAEFGTSSASNPWPYLSIPLYANPYTSPPTPIPAYVRVLAAKNSIDLGIGSTFVGANSNIAQKFFPDDYINNVIYGPSGTTYVTSVYNYFLNNMFNCIIHPANPSPGTTYNYQVTSVSGPPYFNLKFHPTPSPTPLPGYPIPADVYLSLQYIYPTNQNGLTTEELLSGSVWPFTSMPNGGLAGADQKSFTDELSKMVSSLFTIGQFPLLLNYTHPFDVIDSGYGAILPPTPGGNSYFLTGTGSFDKGPWFNLYNKAIHEQQINKTFSHKPKNIPSYGLGYGYDYDDLLNIAGLIQPIIQDPYGNPEPGNPYVVITLGSLAGTPVINVNNDKYTTFSTGISGYEKIPYQIQIGALSAGSETVVTFKWYDNTLTTQHMTLAPVSGQVELTNLTADPMHPFQVEFNFNGDIRTYNINALRQATLPSDPSNSYSTIDQTYITGIVFQLLGMMPQYLLIQINSTNPPWPG